MEPPKKGEIAIEPPPPSLTAPAEEVRAATAPSRRRAPARSAPAARVASLEAAEEIKALPAPARKKASTSAKKTAVKKTAAKKTTTAKKATARKATSAKKTVRKKT